MILIIILYRVVHVSVSNRIFNLNILSNPLFPFYVFRYCRIQTVLLRGCVKMMTVLIIYTNTWNLGQSLILMIHGLMLHGHTHTHTGWSPGRCCSWSDLVRSWAPSCCHFLLYHESSFPIWPGDPLWALCGLAPSLDLISMEFFDGWSCMACISIMINLLDWKCIPPI